MDAFDWKAVECPLCGLGSNHFHDLIEMPLGERLQRAGDVQSVKYVYCDGCGMQFAGEFWTQTSITRFYEDGDYRNSTAGLSPDVTTEDIRHEQNRISVIWPMIAGIVNKIDSYLDVGSSTGALMATMKYHYQPTRVKGIEPSWRYRKYCSLRGLDVVGRIGKLDPRERYDFVTANHVLEHQTDPAGFLAELIPHVGGYLFIQVPIHLPTLAHAVLFTESTLVRICEKAGYTVAAFIPPNPPVRDYTVICEVAR